MTRPRRARHDETPAPTGAVHPVAALFPLLADDELAELAADIKANGLLHPIVLDAEGTLVDGRCRFDACQRVGVEPTYTRLPDGSDAVSYILSANLARRHLSKGARAMLVAQARSISEQSIREAARAAHLSVGSVGTAASVLQHAPALVDGVVAGTITLTTAYGLARKWKRAAGVDIRDEDTAEQTDAADDEGKGDEDEDEETVESLLGDNVSELRQETVEERVFDWLVQLSIVTSSDPDAVAATAVAYRHQSAVTYRAATGEFLAWYERFATALDKHLKNPMRRVK